MIVVAWWLYTANVREQWHLTSRMLHELRGKSPPATISFSLADRCILRGEAETKYSSCSSSKQVKRYGIDTLFSSILYHTADIGVI